MKKTVLLLIALIMSSLSSAQEVMKVELKDGTNIEIFITEIEKIYFEDKTPAVDPDNNNTIKREDFIGVWQRVAEYGYEDGEYYDEREEDGGCDYINYYHFKEDGTYIEYYGECDNTSDYIYWTKDSGTWSYDAQNNTFKLDYFDEGSEILQMNSTGFEIKSVFEDGEYECKIFKKVPESVLDNIPL